MKPLGLPAMFVYLPLWLGVSVSHRYQIIRDPGHGCPSLLLVFDVFPGTLWSFIMLSQTSELVVSCLQYILRTFMITLRVAYSSKL